MPTSRPIPPPSEPLSSKTSNSRSASSPPRRPSASRRRDKPQLSCNYCRFRKSRCDRQQPCSTCSSRGRTCTYVGGDRTAAAPTLHDRLAHLEKLVLRLRSGSDNVSGPDLLASTSTGPPVATATEVVPGIERSDPGSMHVSISELRYIGGEHWAAILEGIADLRGHFDREEEGENLTVVESTLDEETQDGNNNMGSGGAPLPHALLLYGCPTRSGASRAEIIAALPPKDAADRYISRYFDRVDLVSSVIHHPSFLREYTAFWTDPYSVSIIWIGLFFSMMCLALIASPSSSASGYEAEQQQQQISLYREKTVQCLLMGEYTNCGPHALETLIHYVYVEFCIPADAAKDLWFLLALEVNLAMRMGYHRDPSHFPNISPFEGEMRRRVWATVVLGDVLISSQMGMPRMISESQCDTTEPRNLADEDLDSEAIELPLSRPEVEFTTTLGVIVRRRILMALGAVSDLTAAVKRCSYAEVMRVDGILNRAAESISPPLKIKGDIASAAEATDPAGCIMARLFIAHMFYKGQVMLHCRFLRMGVSSSSSVSHGSDPYAYSRQACLDASLGTLKIQRVLHDETKPGGRLHSMRWRVTSAMNHQFYTAAIILCSLLRQDQAQDRERDVVEALTKARAIWIRSEGSREAWKAARTVDMVLARVTGEGEGDACDVGPRVRDSASNQSASTSNGNDGFRMHDLLRPFTPGSQRDRDLVFDIDPTESSTDDFALDEWMMMDGIGMKW
ncbi:related to fungal specific transcription factor [Cephalotrichum gorgonifer]|uniref:Related to fungal specific transcription factor n=1 Tax=Cephalotrichum gorgonifer TaxID=2041049 RepID=A0AAE8N0U8_9PEZI|nr:related to fungal specific transcription factor [Cephalotrichum gorgonifer]